MPGTLTPSCCQCRGWDVQASGGRQRRQAAGCLVASQLASLVHARLQVIALVLPQQLLVPALARRSATRTCSMLIAGVYCRQGEGPMTD